MLVLTHRSSHSASNFAIAPDLLPNYYTAIEKRVYLAASEENISIGIPDIAAIAPEPEHPPTPTLDKNNASTATLSKIGEPQTVILPLTEEIQERYLGLAE